MNVLGWLTGTPLGVTFLTFPLFTIAMFGLTFGAGMGRRRSLGVLAPAVYALIVWMVLALSAAQLGSTRRFEIVDDAFTFGAGVVLAALIGVALVPALYIGELWTSDRLLGWRQRHDGSSTALSFSSALDSMSPMDSNEAVQSVITIARTPVWFAVLSIVGAVGEELLYRAVMLQLLLDVTTTIPALLIQASVYAVNHVPFGVSALLGKLVAGIVFGALAVATGGVLAPLMAHLAFQLLVWRRARRMGERA